MKKQKILTIALSVLLMASISYITYDKIKEKNEKKLLASFEQGVQTGYENAFLQLMNELSACQPVSVFAYNQSYNVIATECFSQFQQLNSS